VARGAQAESTSDILAQVKPLRSDEVQRMGGLVTSWASDVLAHVSDSIDPSLWK